MATTAPNPLLSTSKSSDSRLQVQLHPLVILTISDYITRHRIRKQPGPIVGAIIGTQNGRDITMEHAFECQSERSKNGELLLNDGWFQERLQLYKEVHKAQELDLVGWFTLASIDGPQIQHLSIHHQLQNINDSVLLLTFHPSAVLDGSSKGGKLPLTIYETVWENAEDGDKQMHADGEEAGPERVLRFQEIPYSVETGEAEMIGVDSIAKSAGNASAVADAGPAAPIKPAGPVSSNPLSRGKGKNKGAAEEEAKRAEEAKGPAAEILSSEDEELIAALTARANAIKMLRERITLLKSYLHYLPPCYLTEPPAPPSAEPVPTAKVAPHPQISHVILREIFALVSRLPLLDMPLLGQQAQQQDTAMTNGHAPRHSNEALAERSDVALVSLLGNMGSTLRAAQEMGRKAGVVEHIRASNPRGRRGMVGRGELGGLSSGPMGDWEFEAEMEEYDEGMGP